MIATACCCHAEGPTCEPPAFPENFSAGLSWGVSLPSGTEWAYPYVCSPKWFWTAPDPSLAYSGVRLPGLYPAKARAYGADGWTVLDRVADWPVSKLAGSAEGTYDPAQTDERDAYGSVVAAYRMRLILTPCVRYDHLPEPTTAVELRVEWAAFSPESEAGQCYDEWNPDTLECEASDGYALSDGVTYCRDHPVDPLQGAGLPGECDPPYDGESVQNSKRAPSPYLSACCTGFSASGSDCRGTLPRTFVYRNPWPIDELATSRGYEGTGFTGAPAALTVKGGPFRHRSYPDDGPYSEIQPVTGFDEGTVNLT
ncbi:hypothetical protein [Alienimonas sp. DA493]|uniref:hypothetical protein n=1 Tax=Alienimonas sp. DA493 TaxID=3373605 RepID=UPI003754EB62